MQRKQLTVVLARMPDPFEATAGHQLVEALEPSQTAAPVEFDEGRIDHLLHRRIPTQPDVTGNRFEHVHATRGDDCHAHGAIVDLDQAYPFLPPAVQRAHADRKRLCRIDAQFLAGDAPVLRGLVVVDQNLFPGHGWSRQADAQAEQALQTCHECSLCCYASRTR